VELRHLRYFAAVAEIRHFGKAAERLHMAQPPLSQAIRQLEAELGAELFTRTTRQVNLTRAGEAFYADVTRILKSVDDSVRRVKRIADGRLGVLRIAFTGTAAYQQLPEIARIVKRELPGVGLEIHSDMLTPEQEQALVEGRIDIGVLRPPIRHDSISSRTITVEPLVLVMPEDHRLADEPVVSVADLRAENFVMYAAAGSVVNDAVVRSCMAAGFTPHREHEVAGTAILLALVAAGLGIALVPKSVESVAVNGVVFKPVEGAESVELALAWRADDDSALLESFLTTLEAGGVFHPRAMDAVARTAIASKDAE
jgi:DNA-binding transcriptional LysR family regulator